MLQPLLGSRMKQNENRGGRGPSSGNLAGERKRRSGRSERSAARVRRYRGSMDDRIEIDAY